MLWILLSLFLLSPLPAFAQSTSQNLQALVGGLIVRNPLAVPGDSLSLSLLKGSGGPEVPGNALAQIKSTVKTLTPSLQTTLEFWINRKEQSYVVEGVTKAIPAQYVKGFSIDENGSISSEHGRMTGASDFFWNNQAGILKLFSRSALFSEVGDPVDLVLGRSAGDYPYGPFKVLPKNSNIGHLAWSAFDGSDFKYRVAQIWATNDREAKSDLGSSGSLYFGTTPEKPPPNERDYKWEPLERMVIRPNGDVHLGMNGGGLGIGTGHSSNEPLSYKLQVDGDALAKGSWRQESDIRLKEDINPLKNSLDKILGLKGVSFKFKNNQEQGIQIGVIAQEVEKIVPEVVKTGDDGYKSVSYQNLVPLLIEAIKEQQAEIQNLKKEVETLKNN